MNFLGKRGRKDGFLNIVDRKEYFLEQKRELLKRCKKWQFFKGVSPWFFAKNRAFYHECFFGKAWKKRSLFNILNRKEYFLDTKSEVLKPSENANFFFPCFFFFFFFSKIVLFAMRVF